MLCRIILNEIQKKTDLPHPLHVHKKLPQKLSCLLVPVYNASKWNTEKVLK